MKRAYVYILASSKNGTLYIGVTSNVINRVAEHKTDVRKGFTKKYGVHMLVYYEELPDLVTAIKREKQLKAWKREWKVQLIKELNPGWRDLYEDVGWA